MLDPFKYIYGGKPIQQKRPSFIDIGDITDSLIQLYFQFLQVEYLFSAVYKPPIIGINNDFSDVLQDGTGGPKK
jgi:hypothetical protein